jgi:hypothetical protein
MLSAAGDVFRATTTSTTRHGRSVDTCRAGGYRADPPFRGTGKKFSLGDTLEAMKSSEVNAVVGTIAGWADARHDVRADALAGSWAGNPYQASDVDLLSFTDHNDWYRHRRKRLTEIDFERVGHSLHSSKTAVYGGGLVAAHHLLTSSEVELTLRNAPGRERT